MNYLEATPYLLEFLRRSALTKYLIYGSYAYCYYTKQEMMISDIDIVVSRKCFQDIVEKIRQYNDYEVYDTGKSLHINIKSLSEGEKEPFGFSIDSFEDYFSPTLDLVDSEIVKIDGYEFCLMKVSDLICRYDRDANSNHPKASAYAKKVEVLRKLENER